MATSASTRARERDAARAGAAAPRASQRPSRLDALLAALLGFGAASLLRQHTFYKADGDVYLMSIVEGSLQHPHHMLYKPLVAWLHGLTAPFGTSLYEAALLLSALGTAVGLSCVFVASRWLGLRRGEAWVVTVLVLSVPAVLFFGTVVELHGPFFAFAGPALLAAAALARRPRLGGGVVFGLTLALAYVGHASGALLPCLLLPLALFHPQERPAGPRLRQLLFPALAAAAVFGAFLLAVPALGRITGFGADTTSAAAYVVRDAGAFAADARRWLDTLYYEWLLPYAPLGTLATVACFAGRHRAQARWLLAGVVPYYLVCVFLLPSAEYGAYLTPCAWPLALLALRVAGMRRALGLAVLGAAGGVAWIGAHDRPELAQRFAAGVREATAGRPPFLLLGDHEDLQATLIGLPDAATLVVLHAGAVGDAALPGVLVQLDEILGRARDAGQVVLLTEGAAATLATVVPSGPRARSELLARQPWERVEIDRPDAVFAGWTLPPK